MKNVNLFICIVVLAFWNTTLCTVMTLYICRCKGLHGIDDCSPADSDDELNACPAGKEIKVCVRVWVVNGSSYIQGDPFETLAKYQILCFTYLLENKTYVTPHRIIFLCPPVL